MYAAPSCMMTLLRKLAGVPARQPEQPSPASAASVSLSPRAPAPHLPEANPPGRPPPTIQSWGTDIAALPGPDRFARICDLLSTAVIRDWAYRTVADQPRHQASAPASARHQTSASDRIVAYLALIGQAGMADIRETLGLPKMQAYRATVALIAAGRVTASGRSHQTKYALTPAEAAKAELN